MKISSPLAAVLMLASLVGFQAQAGSETRQVTDADGKTQVVPAQPKRVVVLSEIDLDSALTLGLQPVGTVNGRGQSTLPRYLLDKAGKEIAVVGDLDNPNLETLIDLEPDLILTGQTKPELLALLKEIAPTVVTGNWGEPWKTVFGRSADAMNRGAEAKAFLTRYEARLAEARSKLAQHQGEQMSIVRWNPKGPSYMHGGTLSLALITIGPRRRTLGFWFRRSPYP
ncbi:ABC transporter substrate-binding protein [Aeromonas caviae]|uniref:ABC transporter substrate-binding protein n=1 Tax=Aeromonas caviae TaxID=648 RepID=UPI0025B698FE|nr:ABC transporter substrate-binding protein [Aeromonas caviae]